MELIPDGSRVEDGVSTAVSIGVYDGIHTGHQTLIALLKERAAAEGLSTAIVTFDVHPALVLRPENAPKLLTTLEQRLELLELAEIDYVYLVEFDTQRAQTSSEDFVDEVFVDGLNARVVVVGEDFHFGKGRAGNVETLRELGLDLGFDVTGVELVRRSESAPEPVSSTAIRRALAGGRVAEAAAMLGRYYEIRGEVIEGEKRGRTIGFPTANIPVNTNLAWPADGVYAGWFTRESGSRHPCAINIGRRPTFHLHAEHSLLEAHLLDFDGDLYGESVRVEFVEFLRSEHRFAGVDELVEQLKKDVERTRQVLGA